MLKVLVDLRVDDQGLRRLRALPDVDVDVLENPEEERVRPLPAALLADVGILGPRTLKRTKAGKKTKEYP